MISLSVNRRTVELEVDPQTPLLWVLRDHLGLVGTKFGCGGGFCGACTVHLDGIASRSCQVPVANAQGKHVTTIEGLTAPASTLPDGGGKPAGLHAVQRAWAEVDVPQCGYCQAGQIMTAVALLSRNPNPTDEEIVAGMNGNLCRCGTYHRIRQAVRRAAGAGTEPSLVGPR